MYSEEFESYFRLLWLLVLFVSVLITFLCYLYLAMRKARQNESESMASFSLVLEGQEAERQRIASELHDTVAQDLRYLSLGMGKIGSTEDMAERLKLCDEAASLQSDLIRRVRDICDDLVPPDLRYQGLPDSLRRLCLDFKNKTGIDCRIEISENLNLKFLDEEKQLQIYQIAQESLTNIEKHARAKEAIIIMRSNEDGDLFVGISDDGKGFDASYENREQGGKPPSLGIRSMKKRAELLGGMLVIKSENGEGTLVCLEVPVKRDTNGSSVN